MEDDKYRVYTEEVVQGQQEIEDVTGHRVVEADNPTEAREEVSSIVQVKSVVEVEEYKEGSVNHPLTG